MTATIGKRIARIREHRGMSQSELAAAIGVSRSQINHIEHGHSRLLFEQAAQLADALHCSLANLSAPPDAPLPRIKH